jgi:gluconolactonase
MSKRLFIVFLLTGIVFISSWNSIYAQKNKKDKKYPVTGSVERFSPKMDKIVKPGVLPEIIAEGFEWSEGPLWLPDQEMLIFSDVLRNSIYKWSEKGGSELYLKPSGYTGEIPRGGELGSNGLLLNNEGKLVLCQHGDRRMAVMESPLDKPAPEFKTLADKWDGKRLNSPNDGVFSSKGDLYFTDPAYGMELRFADPKREMNYTGVFKLSKDGVLTLLTDKLSAPNGIGLSPDETKLYVSNTGRGKEACWMEYKFREDGSIDEGRVFFDASTRKDLGIGVPDGLEVRKDGIIFASGPGGIMIFTPEGELLGVIKTGQQTSNCSIDYKGKYLYMTANKYIMRIKLK